MTIPNQIESFRIRAGPTGSELGAPYGAFLVDGPCGQTLKIIATPGRVDERWLPYGMPEYLAQQWIDGNGWDHVSVSCRRRVPNWQEMCFVKDLFFDPEEAVMQLHPPRSTWVNNHPYVLHLWRPTEQAIPLPPPRLV